MKKHKIRKDRVELLAEIAVGLVYGAIFGGGAAFILFAILAACGVKL